MQSSNFKLKMRISSFVPAIMAFTLFTATTQALPAPHEAAAVALLKRGSGSTSSLIDAVAKIFVQAHAKVLVDACVDLSAKVCADVDVKLNAKANVLGLIETEVNVKKLELSAKADVDADIKAKIDVDVKAIVTAKIDGHVRTILSKVCPKSDKVCIKKNAHDIVLQVAALINIDIKKLAVKIKADLQANAKLRLDLFIKKLDINLGLAKVKVSAIAHVRADIDAHLKAFVDICAKLLVNAKIVADIGAL
ncbi:hypothetical protein EC991_006202 [Linnemannia zychae]|nr:hypothetical protein EC991_006202 [Linnemannia zychae]